MRLLTVLIVLAAAPASAAANESRALDKAPDPIASGADRGGGGHAPEAHDGAPDSGDEPRPFGAGRNAMADIDAALERAKANDKRVLLVLGGDWCHDSRSFAAKLEESMVAKLLEERYETVFVDVGRRDRNLDVPRRFGVDSLLGTPTILILSASGELLNPDTVHDWRNAADKSVDDVRALLEE